MPGEFFRRQEVLRPSGVAHLAVLGGPLGATLLIETVGGEEIRVPGMARHVARAAVWDIRGLLP